MSEIIRSNPLAYAIAPNGNCFLSLHTVFYQDKNGRERPYFMCTRGAEPTTLFNAGRGFTKHPEAVVVVGFTDEGQVILTREFRVPIGDYEISFPAGLIDQKDFDETNSVQDAAKLAAVREFKEETGMTFEPKECSPLNLYSSAGMTDESICIIIGKASGKPSYELQEASEDISVMLLQKDEITKIMADQSQIFSKVAWPFLWSFSMWGIPQL